MKTPKLCVVGAGKWGYNHIRTLEKLGSLGGVIDLEESALLSIRKKFPSCLAFQNLEDSFKKKFDAYVVATPPKTHFPIAKRIIEEKKHILIEKPITLKLEDAEVLNKLSKKNNVSLMVGHLLLFHPAFIKIKDIIDKGKIGSIQYIYSNRLNLGSFRNDENVLWSFAPHDISLFNYYFNSLPSGVSSNGADIIQKGVHDTSITTLKYKGNRMGHIFVSWLHPFKEHRFVVIGSKGMLHYEDAGEDNKLIFYKKSVEINGDLPISRSEGTFEVNFSDELPLDAQLKYFISKMNGKIEKANGDDAVKVMKVLELASKRLIKN